MSDLPRVVLCQSVGTREARAVSTACMLRDIQQHRVSAEQLSSYREALRQGALPVGSVEFVRQAMRHANVAEPAPCSYPDEVAGFLCRQVQQTVLPPLASLQAGTFLKPVSTKLFTGFVFQGLDHAYDEHDEQQLKAVQALPLGTPVWMAEPVHFVSEWRFYCTGPLVHAGERYDAHGADDAPEPERSVVEAAAAAMAGLQGGPAAFALDMGVLSDGRTALVEVNDAWAVGLYGSSFGPVEYLQWLHVRWSQLREAAHA